jgi:type II secretory pathway pseudopilin PulG
MHRKSRSIPLAEVLFGMLILGLLGAVAIPTMVYSGDKRADECRANVDLLNSMIEQYTAKHAGWVPKDGAEFEKAVAGDIQRPDAAMPKCPYGQWYAYDPLTGRIVPHRH